MFPSIAIGISSEWCLALNLGEGASEVQGGEAVYIEVPTVFDQQILSRMLFGVVLFIPILSIVGV
jgi:hypothetical protein